MTKKTKIDPSSRVDLDRLPPVVDQGELASSTACSMMYAFYDPELAEKITREGQRIVRELYLKVRRGV